MIVFSLSVKDWNVRNGADAILRMLFFPSKLAESGTAGTVLWVFFSAIILFGAFVFWQMRSKASWKLNYTFLWAGFGEGLGWAVILLLLSLLLFALGMPKDATNWLCPCAPNAGDASLSARMVLSAGAGVYEELVFRLLLTGGIVLMLRGLLGVTKLPAAVIAVLTASLVFSIVHYIGAYGDPLPGDHKEWLGFLFRCLAGVFFSLLFYYRCFGIAVAAHAFYDIIVNLVIAASNQH
ncbi:MAG: CPBP family intramembrane metalloprotease [Planctomycetes bacterium]|nr:CPBP family intramembrane metalloprotease [Planctomycetota bacterium]